MKQHINISSRFLLMLFTGFVLFASCSKDEAANLNPKPNTIDPATGAGNTVLTLTGSGLSGITSINFEKGNVPSNFNPVFNTDGAVVFRVPDTAFGGPQKIIFKNNAGKTFSVDFNVIALPSVTGATNYNFTDGTEITLTGNNLENVTAAKLTAGENLTIVSKSRKELTVKFPVSALNRATLDITNSTGTITTTQEFVNFDKAYKIFTDAYGADFGDGSWGDGAVISSTIFKSGTKSVSKKYAKGNWHLINFANWWPSVTEDPSWKFMTFWIRGGSQQYDLYVTSDKGVGGFGAFEESNKVTVLPNVWNYYKIPMTTLKLFNSGSPVQQLGFRIKGPDAQDETFYFDDVMFIK